MAVKLAIVSNRPEPVENTDRHIQTVYYADVRGNHVIKTTRSRWALNAVPNCIKHMQLNEYEAQLAEVYDTSTGELHAVIKHSVTSQITILFKRDLHEGM